MREQRMTFRISDAKKAELEVWAERYGVTSSALISVILAEWLQAKVKQEQVHEAMVANATEILREQMVSQVEAIGNEKIEKALLGIQKSLGLVK